MRYRIGKVWAWWTNGRSIMDDSTWLESTDAIYKQRVGSRAWGYAIPYNIPSWHISVSVFLVEPGVRSFWLVFLFLFSLCSPLWVLFDFISYLFPCILLYCCFILDLPCPLPPPPRPFSLCLAHLYFSSPPALFILLLASTVTINNLRAYHYSSLVATNPSGTNTLSFQPYFSFINTITHVGYLATYKMITWDKSEALGPEVIAWNVGMLADCFCLSTHWY